MKSYIPRETAAIFFFLANIFLKEGISSKYVIVVFICMGLLDRFGTRTENYKMKNSCSLSDLNQGPSAYEADALSVELLELINIDHLKVRAFNMSFLCKLPVPRVHFVLHVLFLEFLSCICLIIFVSFCCLTYFRRLLTVKS